MAEPIKISTSKYVKQGKVEVDGNVWELKIPGAGTELRFSQASRMVKLYGARLSNLDSKFETLLKDNKNISDEDLDNYEQYEAKYRENERIVYETLQGMLRDNTKDNNSVKKWLDETPMVIIMQVFEDLNNQADKVNEATDGQSEPTASTG